MSASNAQELKQLQTRLSELQVEIRHLDGKMNELSQKKGRANRRIDEIRRKIKSFQKKEITVTEHAVLRYLERVKGVDLRQANEEILTEDVVKVIDRLSNAKIPLKNGGTAIVKNRTVITIK